MMNRPSTKQVLLLILSGILSPFLWVWLLGLGAAYDTPLLNLEISIGLRGSIFFINESLFCFLSAALFTVLLRLLFRGSFPVAAAIFITTFLLVYLAPDLVRGNVASLFSFSTLWLFIMFFAACVFLSMRFQSRGA